MISSNNFVSDFSGVPIIPMSNVSDEGVMKVKSEACDRLLSQRVEVKLKNSKKMGEVVNRLHIAMPKPRDNKERPPFIPVAAKKKGNFVVYHIARCRLSCLHKIDRLLYIIFII